jgi:hypothetical protein
MRMPSLSPAVLLGDPERELVAVAAILGVIA